MPKQPDPVPISLLASAPANSTASLPELEREHVQKVYDAVAQQWHGTRYKAWPRVEEFIRALPPHSLIADLGCGNGKMAPACREGGNVAIGCDFSIELVRIAARQQGLEAQAADVMAVPYRSGRFDAALSIAVLHHVSTPERRALLVQETLRVLRPGGVALFYAWAAEQGEGPQGGEGGRSGHDFPEPDVFVPFHSRLPKEPKPTQRPPARAAAGEAPGRGRGGGGTGDRGSGSDAGGSGHVAALEAMGGVFDPSKRSVVFQRYCHVYRQGELRALIEAVGGATVLDEYYDTGNWCLAVRKDGAASVSADAGGEDSKDDRKAAEEQSRRKLQAYYERYGAEKLHSRSRWQLASTVGACATVVIVAMAFLGVRGLRHWRK